jgi:predicted  nucleic acid-binding Zn-ribbon protein
MSGAATILREIHRLRRHAVELQGRVEQGPRMLRAQQGNVTKKEEALRQAQDEIKKLKVAIHEKEVSLKTRNQQIVKHEKQLNQAAGKKEYDALKLEIETDRKEVPKLEDAILDAMAEVEDKTARLPEWEKALQQAKADLAAYERDSGARLAALAEEREKVLRQLAEIEASIPPDVREPYDRITKVRGEDALAAVVDRTCSACYTEITAQGYNELLAERFVLCKSCGRILYLPAQ